MLVQVSCREGARLVACGNLFASLARVYCANEPLQDSRLIPQYAPAVLWNKAHVQVARAFISRTQPWLSEASSFHNRMATTAGGDMRRPPPSLTYRKRSCTCCSKWPRGLAPMRPCTTLLRNSNAQQFIITVRGIVHKPLSNHSELVTSPMGQERSSSTAISHE